MAEQDGGVAAQLRALAFACLDFEDAATDALLDAGFAADAAQRRAWADRSALAARHLGGDLLDADATSVARISAMQGNLRCLRWGLPRSVDVDPWGRYTCTFAAMIGHLDCLQYAHEHGCEWDERVCTYAAKNGHLDCLTYAREHGCPWSDTTCVSAAQHGHLDCLQYAHEHGCPWDAARVYRTAANNGHLDCLTYARKHA